MSTTELPFRATTAEACDWLALQTGDAWDLARLIGNGLLPFVWLDYDASYPELFGDANGGYAAPIFFEGDTQRLAAGSDDVLVTMTKDAYRIVVTLPAPGFRRELHELRFQKRDIERLAAQLKRAAEPPPAQPVVAKESQAGINRDQVLLAFGRLVKFDMAQALDAAEGIFSDDGARVKASARRSKKNAVWNPVTLALGLNDNFRVPIGHLKKAFAAHAFLDEWAPLWNETLDLLGSR
jgi:hypothetical protein